MARPNSTIRQWLKLATPDEARVLAKAADTSVPHLRHIAAGRRNISAELAQRLAHASKPFNILMRLAQRDLCRACAKCPLL